jgi:hypothetical protein
MDQPRIMLVRGTPVVDTAGWTGPQLRRWVNEPTTLRSLARRWLALDLDDVTVPAPLGDGGQLHGSGVFVRDHLLPPEFGDTRMIACATSSTGLKGSTIARLRLFVLLDQAIDDGTLKQWARGVRAATDLPLDDSLFQAGQPHYTARPKFEGRSDPVPPDCRVVVGWSAPERAASARPLPEHGD